jgi:hypothetical protein
MLEGIICIVALIMINIATVCVTIYKLSKKYKRPWPVVLKRLDKRVKPGYGRVNKYNIKQ